MASSPAAPPPAKQPNPGAKSPRDPSSSSSSPRSSSSILSSLSAAFFGSSSAPLFVAAFALRAVLLLYGLWQDANSSVKYTDIDYLVFTDAARYTAAGGSPYDRETYRYTPLLAWMLLPTAVGSLPSSAGASPSWVTAAWFSFGKVLFALADLVAGWLIVRILTMAPKNAGAGAEGETAAAMTPARARKYAVIWLLNPMVATISTRGSSEGLLGVLVMALLWAVLARRITLAGLLLGLGVHFKIYPFIYAPAIVWWLDGARSARSPTATPATAVEAAKQGGKVKEARLIDRLDGARRRFLTPERIQLTVVSLATFAGLNALMFAMYGRPFVQHTFLHHVSRVDHRHNFSPYNIQLYLTSAATALASSPSSSSSVFSNPAAPPLVRIESVAFVPQLLLSTVLIPLVMAKRDLPTTMMAQTFAFVTFNKVCTSQYFLWYMIFLPTYLPRSSLLPRNTGSGSSGRRGALALALWVAGQALWLHQGFRLEFLGITTFVPGLWLSSLLFFGVNCWILGVVVGDAAALSAPGP